MNRIKPIVFCLLLVINFLLSVKSPAFAQGDCDPGENCCTVEIEAGTRCTIKENYCESGYEPDIRGSAPSCICACIKPSFAIPKYEDIPEFKKSFLATKWVTIGDIFSDALKYIYIFAGLGVFVYLIFGGFQLMTSGGDPAGISAGAGKIKNALIGFMIIFASYWLIQIIEVIFGMTIL